MNPPRAGQAPFGRRKGTSNPPLRRKAADKSPYSQNSFASVHPSI